MVYENRIVIFFDILGFRNLVNNSAKISGKEYDKVKWVLSYIKKFYKDEISKPYFTSKQISFFSDSVIISFEEKEISQTFYTFCDLQILLMNLASNGFVMRGALSYGKLFHDKSFLFGPAFMEAYDNETKKAIFPRIILDKSILLLNQGKKSQAAFKEDLPYFFDILSIDDDGLLFFDYFYKGCNNLDSEEQFFQYMGKLKMMIELNLAAARKLKNRKVKAKYLWMKSKFNESVRTVKKEYDKRVIESQGLKPLFDQIQIVV